MSDFVCPRVCALQVQIQMDRGELPGQQRPEEQAKINAKREAKLRQEEEQRAKEAAAARKEEEKKLRAERDRQKEVPTLHLSTLMTGINSRPPHVIGEIRLDARAIWQSIPFPSAQNTRCMELVADVLFDCVYACIETEGEGVERGRRCKTAHGGSCGADCKG